MLSELVEGRTLLSVANAAGGMTSVQSEPPPFVAAVYVSGSRWTQTFKDYLASRDWGSPLYGYYPDEGEALSWVNVDQITMLFSRGDMIVDAADLTVRGVTVRNYVVASVEVEPRPYTVVTWTLERPLANDRIVIELNGDAPDGVREGPAGRFLDGDLDSIAGGDFRRHLSCLPANASPDGSVNALDLAAVKQDLGHSAGEQFYTDRSDVDASGRINALDLAAVRQRLNNRFPPAEPAAAAALTTPPAGISVAKELFASAPILA